MVDDDCVNHSEFYITSCVKSAVFLCWLFCGITVKYRVTRNARTAYNLVFIFLSRINYGWKYR